MTISNTRALDTCLSYWYQAALILSSHPHPPFSSDPSHSIDPLVHHLIQDFLPLAFSWSTLALEDIYRHRQSKTMGPNVLSLLKRAYGVFGCLSESEFSKRPEVRNTSKVLMGYLWGHVRSEVMRGLRNLCLCRLINLMKRSKGSYYQSWRITERSCNWNRPKAN
ncbi:hypothetical protein TREMEDRAFT_72562, partial [Tremella mesenterica DSM 1558]|uniref:uncharacterized protein n=1 Tax=Tremella mesenterica (strain ATCC 24925 / CBS 8224 / DSM 1558 / NBRC 9311 / NRRL Y-6157 / RJB 2259-6 / UBC 559-6) TaxID=578456 RepID=UPI00032D4CD8